MIGRRILRRSECAPLSDIIWIRVADATQVSEGEALAIEAGRLRLGLFRVEGMLFCIDNICTHAHALLTEGWLEGHTIECPLHAGQFDLRTGCGMGPPIARDVQTYPVREEDGGVLIGVPHA